MSKKILPLFVVCLVIVTLAVGGGTLWFTAQLTYASSKRSLSKMLAVTPSEAIGDHLPADVDTRQLYVLVEFADYECPPCRRAVPRIQQFLRGRKERVAFVFRNLPLTEIHPNALPAALLAETARESGRFDSVHDALYAEPSLTSAYMERIARENDLTVSVTAKKAVEKDQLAASKLGVTGTPTFLLCCPDGRVVRLSDIGDAEGFLSVL